jgi:predicted PolB exonuclease-like 3'-5' exonuclease
MASRNFEYDNYLRICLKAEENQENRVEMAFRKHSRQLSGKQKCGISTVIKAIFIVTRERE